MRKFSLKQMFASVTMLSTGIAIVAWIFRYESIINPPLSESVASILWLLGGVLVGTGLFTPFGRPRTGAMIGFAVQAVLLAAIYALLSNFAA